MTPWSASPMGLPIPSCSPSGWAPAEGRTSSQRGQPELGPFSITYCSGPAGRRITPPAFGWTAPRRTTRPRRPARFRLGTRGGTTPHSTATLTDPIRPGRAVTQNFRQNWNGRRGHPAVSRATRWRKVATTGRLQAMHGGVMTTGWPTAACAACRPRSAPVDWQIVCSPQDGLLPARTGDPDPFLGPRPDQLLGGGESPCLLLFGVHPCHVARAGWRSGGDPGGWRRLLGAVPKKIQLSGKVTFKGQRSRSATSRSCPTPPRGTKARFGSFRSGTGCTTARRSKTRASTRADGRPDRRLDGKPLAPLFPQGKQIFNVHELHDKLAEGTKDFDVPPRRGGTSLLLHRRPGRQGELTKNGPGHECSWPGPFVVPIWCGRLRLCSQNRSPRFGGEGWGEGFCLASQAPSPPSPSPPITGARELREQCLSEETVEELNVAAAGITNGGRDRRFMPGLTSKLPPPG